MDDLDAAEWIHEAIGKGDGWAILDDTILAALDANAATACDCARMVICLDGGPSVAWVYRIGSQPVHTIDIPLAELAQRLGAPLSNPLRSLGCRTSTDLR